MAAARGSSSVGSQLLITRRFPFPLCEKEHGVAAREELVDWAIVDSNPLLVGIEGVRKFNPQRFEMEQLSGILYEDAEKKICVGYKDVAPDEFWTRGHMPGMPLMPGVLMCEAAAQLASYYVQSHDMLGAEMLGFGGLEEVRFRGPVRPGDRLIIACQLLKVRRGAMINCRFQLFVNKTLICDGGLKGIPLPLQMLSEQK